MNGDIWPKVPLPAAFTQLVRRIVLFNFDYRGIRKRSFPELADRFPSLQEYEVVVPGECYIVTEGAESVLDNRNDPKLTPSTMVYADLDSVGTDLVVGEAMTLEAVIRYMIAAYFGLRDAESDAGSLNPQASLLGTQAERLTVQMHMYCRGKLLEPRLPVRAEVDSAYFLYDWNSSEFMYWFPISGAFAFDTRCLLARTDCPGPQPNAYYSHRFGGKISWPR